MQLHHLQSAGVTLVRLGTASALPEAMTSASDGNAGGGGGVTEKGGEASHLGEGEGHELPAPAEISAGAGNAARGRGAALYPHQPEAEGRKDEDARGESPQGKATGLTRRRRSHHVDRVRGGLAEAQEGRARRRAFPSAGIMNASRARFAPQQLSRDPAW